MGLSLLLDSYDCVCDFVVKFEMIEEEFLVIFIWILCIKFPKVDCNCYFVNITKEHNFTNIIPTLGAF
jgi:hypothetical protein